MRDALDGVPFEVVGTDLPKVKEGFSASTSQGSSSLTEIHIGRNPRPMSLERYDCIPPGGGRFDLPDHLLPECWAKKSHRHHRRHGSDAVGRAEPDHPYRVLQAREGPVPAPAVGSADPHGGSTDPSPTVKRRCCRLSSGLPVVRHQDRDRQADRQRRTRQTRLGYCPVGSLSVLGEADPFPFAGTGNPMARRSPDRRLDVQEP